MEATGSGRGRGIAACLLARCPRVRVCGVKGWGQVVGGAARQLAIGRQCVGAGWGEDEVRHQGEARPAGGRAGRRGRRRRWERRGSEKKTTGRRGGGGARS